MTKDKLSLLMLLRIKMTSMHVYTEKRNKTLTYR